MGFRPTTSTKSRNYFIKVIDKVNDPHHNLSASSIKGTVLGDDLHTRAVPCSSVTAGIQIESQGGNNNLTINFSLGNFSRVICDNTTRQHNKKSLMGPADVVLVGAG